MFIRTISWWLKSFDINDFDFVILLMLDFLNWVLNLFNSKELIFIHEEIIVIIKFIQSWKCIHLVVVKDKIDP